MGVKTSVNTLKETHTDGVRKQSVGENVSTLENENRIIVEWKEYIMWSFIIYRSTFSK
jgi:hypothetical protein